MSIQPQEPNLNNGKASISKRTNSTHMSKSETNQSTIGLNEKNKTASTSISTQNRLESKRKPKFVDIPNSITVGRYIQFKNIRKLYKVIDKDRYNLIVQDSDYGVSTLKYAKDLISMLSDLHIAVLKKEAISIDAIKEKLLNTPIKNSIEIITATGLKPLHYGLMKPYLVPSIFNVQEWEAWESR